LSGRFAKGQSGNPNGRPRGRRPNVSAFDIIFDKTLTVTQAGIERELTVDEALEQQTYLAAIKGSKLAVRAVLKMIEKREHALRKAAPEPVTKPMSHRLEYDSDSADEAMLLLDITAIDESWPGGPDRRRKKIQCWAAQAAISRPGRSKLSDRRQSDLNLFVHDYDKLRWPRVSAK